MCALDHDWGPDQTLLEMSVVWLVGVEERGRLEGREGVIYIGRDWGLCCWRK